jgi:hypothetical protein
VKISLRPANSLTMLPIVLSTCQCAGPAEVSILQGELAASPIVQHLQF